MKEFNGSKYVIRVSPLCKEKQFFASLYWHGRFETLDIALPKIISHGFNDKYLIYLILERIPGTDLGNIYNGLTHVQKEEIVRALVNIQNKVGTMPQAYGYGYAGSYEDMELLPTWKSFIQKMVNDNQKEIIKSRIFDISYIKKLQEKLDSMDSYFSRILPEPFLNDTTTKNVIVDDGKLSGIVDVEEVCFGDRLLVLGLTRMALLSKGMSTDYIAIWEESWVLNRDQKRALSFYTLLFCVDFMKEVSYVFSNQTSGDIYEENIPFYKNIFDRIDAEF